MFGVQGLGVGVEGVRALGLVADLEREFFTDNPLVRIHLIIEMVSVDWPCAMGV